jgi:hypothetical protein
MHYEFNCLSLLVQINPQIPYLFILGPHFLGPFSLFPLGLAHLLTLTLSHLASPTHSPAPPLRPPVHVRGCPARRQQAAGATAPWPAPRTAASLAQPPRHDQTAPPPFGDRIRKRRRFAMRPRSKTDPSIWRSVDYPAGISPPFPAPVIAPRTRTSPSKL